MTELRDSLCLAAGPAWRNRLGLAPLTNMQSHDDGSLSEEETAWLLRRADGGFGMVMTAAAFVSPEGKAWAGQLGVHDVEMLPGLERLAHGLRSRGAPSSVQLYHGGRRADPQVSHQPAIAPWAKKDEPFELMSTADVHKVIDDFHRAAGLAMRAGFDGVEIHGAHGYLLAQFLDPRNERTDGYGGDFEDRSRFVREIVAAVRDAIGPEGQLGLRLSPERMGVVLDEAVSLTSWALASAQLDYVDVSLWDVRKEPHEEAHAGTRLIDHFMGLQRGSCRLTVAGGVLSAEDAVWCLAQGADAVFVGTGGIVHHDFAQRAVADPQFRAVAVPVSRRHLELESVGLKFVDYLATRWDDFVLD